MKKLRLELETLAVQSFTTDEDSLLPYGTVYGRQGQPTGQQDTECSAVDACASARGCSEIAECRPTEGTNCPSAALACPSSRGCTRQPGCENPSAVDACPSARGCTEVGCNAEPA
ncbi:MAG TPA: hypothetical protein VFQ45_18430 [Longimicrobium sp.]|nr:hypothetical protein [Longimicrobium sp.]